MSRNGSGVYSLPAGNPVVTGTTISSSWANTTLSDIASALTGSVAADGQTPMTGNLQMGSNKITGIAVATATGDALSYNQAATVTTLTTTGNVTIGGTLTLTGGLTLNGNVTVGDSSSDTLTVNATSTFAAGATFSSTFAANGGTTLGDASGDALTINSSAVSIPNGLNFDSNTFVIDATNNRVGVGVASPATRLDAFGNGETNIAKLVGGGNLTLYSYHDAGGVGWATGAAGSYVNLMYMDSTNNFRIFTNSAERMRITSAGNLLLGGTTGTERLSLYSAAGVYGAARLSASFSDTTSFAAGVGGGITFNGKFNTAGDYSAFGHIKGIKENATDGNSAGALVFSTIAAGGSPVEQMRITSAGNVGIGTSSPASALHIARSSGGGVPAQLPNIIASNTIATASPYALSSVAAWTLNETLKIEMIADGSGVLTGTPAGGLFTRTNHPLIFGTNDTVRMRLDSSGNLGLGVTPSAWASGYKAIQFGNSSSQVSALFSNGTNNNWYISNSFFDGTNWKYIATGSATAYSQFNGTHSWQYAGSGTAGNNLSWTQAMTLDAGGNLCVGTTTASAGITSSENLSVQNGYAAVNTGTTYGQGYQFFRFLNSSLAYTGAISHTESTGIGLYSASNLILGTGTTERVRIDTSGNLTIASNNSALIFRNNYQSITTDSAGNDLTYRTYANHIWLTTTTNANTTSGTERMRIDSSGNLLVGTTNPSIYSYSTATGININNNGTVFASSSGMTTAFNRTTSDGTVTGFYRAGNLVGSISVTTTATAFNTSSDYRLKDNQSPLTGSGSFIDSLQPKTWSWTADGSTGVGFIAHEVQAVSPNSVVGEKDAVDAEGNPIMQAMEYGSAEFIANIIAELQDLRKRVAVLESK